MLPFVPILSCQANNAEKTIMTTTPLTGDLSNVSPQQSDRSALLIGVGICQILMALPTFALGDLSALGAAVGSRKASAAVSPSTHMLAGIVFLLFAGIFFVTGIGSILAKRWARALMEAISWVWLAFGILLSFLLAAVLPPTLSARGHLSRGGIVAAVVVVCFFAGAFTIVLPGIFVLIYRSSAVKATCERKNPSASWTDRLPVAPLILCLLMSYDVLMDIYLGLSKPLFPFFGTYLTNWTGRFAFIAFGFWRVFLAWDLFHLRLRAWRAALITYIFVAVSTGLTYMRADVTSAYSRLGMPESRIAAASRMMKNPAFLSVQVAAMVAMVVFVAALRKYYQVQTSGSPEINPLTPVPEP